MKNLIMRTGYNYSLVARILFDENLGIYTVHEYVVAYKYNVQADAWGQGHYFQTIESALKFYHTKEK